MLKLATYLWHVKGTCINLRAFDSHVATAPGLSYTSVHVPGKEKRGNAPRLMNY